jgi:hypothetical protein
MSLAALPYEEVLDMIRPVGLAPTKAKNIINAAKMVGLLITYVDTGGGQEGVIYGLMCVVFCVWLCVNVCVGESAGGEVQQSGALQLPRPREPARYSQPDHTTLTG